MKLRARIRVNGRDVWTGVVIDMVPQGTAEWNLLIDGADALEAAMLADGTTADVRVVVEHLPAEPVV